MFEGLVERVFRSKISSALVQTVIKDTIRIDVQTEVKKNIDGNLEKITREYIESEKFRQDFKDAVDAYLLKLVTDTKPVLVLDKEQFESYKQQNPEMIGPLNTIAVNHESSWGYPRAYKEAIEILKQKALENLGSIVYLKEKTNKSLTSHDNSWAVTLIGDVYRRRLK